VNVYKRALIRARLRALLKGGPGSGNFGHEGRPGEVGGSGPGGEGGGGTGKPPRMSSEKFAAAKEKWSAAMVPSNTGPTHHSQEAYKLATELGPEFFHQLADEDNEFYQSTVTQMSEAWAHIGGVATNVKFAADKAFGSGENPQFDVKRGAFVIPPTFHEAADDDASGRVSNRVAAEVTMWAGVMRREYSETQNDLTEGRTMTIAGDEGEAIGEWYNSDHYSEWYAEQQSEAWGDVSTSDKLDYVHTLPESQYYLGGKDDTHEVIGHIADDLLTGNGTLADDFRDEVDGASWRDSEGVVHEIDKNNPESLNQLRTAMFDVVTQRDAIKAEFEAARASLPSKPEYPYNKPELVEQYTKDQEAYQAAYKEIYETYSSETLGLYQTANDQFGGQDGVLLNEGVKSFVESEKGTEVVQERWGEDYHPDEFAESVAAQEWAVENHVGEEYEIDHDFLKDNTLYRSVNADTEHYVPGAVESWSVESSIAGGFGTKQLKKEIDPKRVLVFQGATNWAAEGFGLREGEVMVLADTPFWVPRDADGDGNLDEDEDESDEVYTEDTEAEGKSRRALIAKRLHTLVGHLQAQLGKGGPGSGNFGHEGRPGEVGGSGAGGGSEGSRAMRSQPSSSYPVANSAGQDTLELYRQENGTFTPERQALHDEIREEMLAKATPVDEPVVYIMGGGPAAGKSSMISKLDIPVNHVGSDPDYIKTQLPEFAEEAEAGNTAAGTFVHEESSLLGKEVAREAIESGKNTVLDGTGDSSYESLSAKVEGYRAAGATKIVANYATVDVETAVQRMEARGEKTGRYVPETYMREVYKNIGGIVPQAFKNDLFDELTLWDNSGKAPSKIAFKAKGGVLEVYDSAAWFRFSGGNKP